MNIFWKKRINKKQTETPDPTPVAMPVQFHRPPTLQEQMRKYVRSSLNNLAEQTGHETFEDANDFDIGEEIDPASPHELEFGAQKEAEFEKFAAQQLADKNARLKAIAAQQRAAGKTDPEGSVPAPQNTPKPTPDTES